MIKLLTFCLVMSLMGLLGACEESVNFTPDCHTPRPSSANILYGQYTWIDNTKSVLISVNQLSTFQFRSDSLGNPTRFTLRVDTSLVNPVRGFGDLTATYRILNDTLFIDSVIYQAQNNNTNTPFGVFLFSCTPDSFIFLGGTQPGLNSADTVMRISIRR